MGVRDASLTGLQSLLQVLNARQLGLKLMAVRIRCNDGLLLIPTVRTSPMAIRALAFPVECLASRLPIVSCRLAGRHSKRWVLCAIADLS